MRRLLVFAVIFAISFGLQAQNGRNKISDYIKEGNSAEEQYRIGDALRYYYWALMLCQSKPNGKDFMFKDDNGLDVNGYRWLMRHMENVLSEIVFIPVRQEKSGSNEFMFKVSYFGNNINGLNYSYNNGNGMIKGTVDNGVTRVRLVHSAMHNVNIVIDLDDIDVVKFYDPEVYAIINSMDEPIDFPDARKSISIDKAKIINKIDEIKSYSDKILANNMAKSEIFINEVEVEGPTSDYLKSMSKIEKAISNKNITGLDDYFMPEALHMLSELLSYGDCRIIGKPSYKLLEYEDEVLCRALPMEFDFRNNVSFIRDVVFRFDKNTKKVNSLAFRLTDITESQILAKDRWSDEARLTLISFIEDYQTAYALKRKEYLNQIYSESALIIVGSVLKETKKTDNIHLKDKVKVKYDTLSKSQYLRRLDKVFDNNEFVNVRFTNTSFNTVNGINNVIGVQLKQEYFSSTYGDVGYLFLMVDLRHEKPMIHVRTWQPNETEVNDLIDETSFVFE